MSIAELCLDLTHIFWCIYSILTMMYEDVWGMIMSHAGPQRNLQYQIKTLTPCSSQNHPWVVFCSSSLMSTVTKTESRRCAQSTEGCNLGTWWRNPMILDYPRIKRKKKWHGSLLRSVSLLNHLFHEYYLHFHSFPLLFLVLLCSLHGLILWCFSIRFTLFIYIASQKPLLIDHRVRACPINCCYFWSAGCLTSTLQRYHVMIHQKPTCTAPPYPCDIAKGLVLGTYLEVHVRVMFSVSLSLWRSWSRKFKKISEKRKFVKPLCQTMSQWNSFTVCIILSCPKNIESRKKWHLWSAKTSSHNPQQSFTSPKV